MYTFLSYTFTLKVLSHSKIQVEVYTYHPNNGKNDIEKEYRLQKTVEKDTKEIKSL